MIKVSQLSKRYGDKVAVNDLSFDIAEGRVTGFLGPNGAGKSTTMRLMLGLDHGSGSTTFDGTPYRSLRHPMRVVGALLEPKAFHPTRSARNHLRMLAAANGIPAQRVEEVLALVGLQDVAHKKPKGFSLGMGQRLGLAAALLGDPGTLILDEPSNGLDPQGISWLRAFLRGYAASGRTVLVSSHLLAEMTHLADHLLVIGRGELLEDAPTEELLAGAAGAGVLVRTPRLPQLLAALPPRGVSVSRHSDDTASVSGVNTSELGQLAFQVGIPVHELTTKSASLEDVFLEVTGRAQEYYAGAAMTTGAER